MIGLLEHQYVIEPCRLQGPKAESKAIIFIVAALVLAFCDRPAMRFSGLLAFPLVPVPLS